MSRVAVLLLLAPLAGCFHTAPPLVFDEPQWVAGEQWSMISQDLIGGVARIDYRALGPGPNGTWQFVVKAAGAPNATMYVSPATMRFDANPQVASRPPAWPWPLTDGETWQAGSYSAVVHVEDAQTELGSMRSARVTFSNETGPVQDLWYSPRAKFWARVVDHPTATATVLAAYTVS